MSKTEALEELVRMSRNLGRPDRDWVILGEGNTSAKIDGESFLVKVSGAYLAGCTAESFVEVRLGPVLEMLDGPDLTDDEINVRLAAAQASRSDGWPSIETVFHAYLLTLPGVNFVGHTHPVAVNAILCSNAAAQIYQSRIFPDEIIFCGVRPVFMPYVDPGMKLARAMRESVQEYVGEEGVTPKVILMQNHGFIALGANGHEVEAITAMGVKTARILAGAYQLGGIHYMTKENIERIYTRPDEEYRRRQFGG